MYQTNPPYIYIYTYIQRTQFIVPRGLEPPATQAEKSSPPKGRGTKMMFRDLSAKPCPRVGQGLGEGYATQALCTLPLTQGSLQVQHSHGLHTHRRIRLTKPVGGGQKLRPPPPFAVVSIFPTTAMTGHRRVGVGNPTPSTSYTQGTHPWPHPWADQGRKALRPPLCKIQSVYFRLHETASHQPLPQVTGKNYHLKVSQLP